MREKLTTDELIAELLEALRNARDEGQDYFSKELHAQIEKIIVDAVIELRPLT